MSNLLLASVLARSFLEGEPELEQLIIRGTRTLGRPWYWLWPLAQKYIESFAGKIRPRHRDVVRIFLADPDFNLALQEHSHQISVVHWLTEGSPMQPIAVARSWKVPILDSVSALADWLWLEYGDLDWFADLKGLGYKNEVVQLQHYHYKVLSKPSGSIRLIESPKPRLKKMQREILSEILEKIPAHPAVHGFLKGRSIKTFAAPHVGQGVVLRMDLQDFFGSIGGVRIQTMFRMIGYSELVADLLGGICTNAVPLGLWNSSALGIDPSERRKASALYSRPHLPQGAPTSPALANICAFRLDCRLTGLANSFGAQYTRYADDLALSGSGTFEKDVNYFSTCVAGVLLEEKFTVNYRKTRIMRRGVRQHLAGVVTNQRINLVRADFDRLKAMLTNCVRRGPESQNREHHPAFRSHLEGRIAFVQMLNPAKAERLRAVFELIRWP